MYEKKEKRQTDLNEEFINILQKKGAHKKELAHHIADLLKIEKESAYRRISGKVQFTIREMGILAENLNISLDSLLVGESDVTPLLFNMNFDSHPRSLESVASIIEQLVSSINKMNIKKGAAGLICDRLPIEFYMYYPYLSKFIYFKWGHYYNRGKEFSSYSDWVMPGYLGETERRYKNSLRRFERALYIWDCSLIPNLINEIKYHQQIHCLIQEDIKLIKNDLHDLISSLEEFVDGDDRLNPYGVNFEFYVTNFRTAVYTFYLLDDHSALSGIRTQFLHSVIHDDYPTGQKIYKWINSMKKFSFLISQSGEKERRLFFTEQHRIIDTI